MRFRLYIDESGDHVYRHTDEPGHRYLCLTGCIINTEEYLTFHNELEAFKQKHFPHNPDEPVILHRKDIINRKGLFWRLRDTAIDKSFKEELIELMDSADFKVIGIVVDKHKLYSQYPTPFHPYHMALGFMLQRYCGYLNHLDAKGDVLAESRGGKEDRLLKSAYRHIFTHGDMHRKARFYQQVLTSKELKLKKKTDNTAGLQLADLIATAVKKDIIREFRESVEIWPTFDDEIIDFIKNKYNKHLYDGRIEGYGRVIFPK